MINTSLSRMFYIQLYIQDPFTKLRNWLFTCKISSNNIRHVIFGICHDVPRGLVVRIRRSHHRGPGSIPGVGMISFFWIISFCLLSWFDQSPRLCVIPYSLTSWKMRKCAFLYFRGSDTGSTTWLSIYRKVKFQKLPVFWKILEWY